MWLHEVVKVVYLRMKRLKQRFDLMFYVQISTCIQLSFTLISMHYPVTL